jgi:hypothetical protein
MMHSAPDRRLSTITTTQRGFSGNAAGPVQSFISASGISDLTQVSAINTLYTDLVSANITGTSLWDKIQVLYPFVGGNATAHAVNFKNATQYPLTFTGSIVHSTNGVSGTPSANASYSTTYDMSLLSPSDLSFGAYHRSPLGGASSNSTALFNTSTGYTYVVYRGDAFSTNTTRVGLTTGGLNPGFTGTSTAKFAAITSDSATTMFSFVNQYAVTTGLIKGNFISGTISASLSASTGTTNITMSVWYVATSMTEAELVVLNGIFQKFNNTLDTAFGSTRGTDYYINPNYDRDVNRYVSNIQIPGVSTFTVSELDALNYLITALKGSTNSLYGSLIMLAPLLGSTLAGRIRNFIGATSPALITNGTNFNFSSAIGLEGNSNTSYILSGFTINGSIGIYITEDIQSNNFDLGHSLPQRMSFTARNTSNQLSLTTNGAVYTTSNTDARGLYQIVYPTAGAPTGSVVNLYKGSTLLTSSTMTNGGNSGQMYYLGGTTTVSTRGVGVLYNAGPGVFNLAAITEMNTILSNYLTMLGRI